MDEIKPDADMIDLFDIRDTINLRQYSFIRFDGPDGVVCRHKATAAIVYGERCNFLYSINGIMVDVFKEERTWTSY